MVIREFLGGIALILIQITIAEKQTLNDYIRHYEELTYDTDLLHQNHIRAKRSTRDPYLSLHFQAHGRDFNLRLRRDTTTFSQNVKLERSDGTLVPHDVSHIYQGELWGEPNSQVHGSIIEGIFEGTIHSSRETYHIEKAAHYFHHPTEFHSIIYADKDVDLSAVVKDDPERGTCGSANKDIHKWMQSVQKSAVPQEESPKEPPKTESAKNENEATNSKPQTVYHQDMYTSHRNKRATAPIRGTCTLFLQSDTEMWDYMTGAIKDKKLGYSATRAFEEITSLFSTHVNGLKRIYEDTIFKNRDGSIDYKGISFVVHRVKINTTADCEGDNAAKNHFCQPNIDVSNFLNLNSLRNHNDFCLAYVFTYRDFTGGTLGLAWVGSPSRASGGICERYKEYSENSQKIWKSLNTGIVTLINYANRVPPKVSTLTFAHEVGHNFGSPHDSGSQCTPFAVDPESGNFIMYASATSGDRPNNSKFSPCSKDNISQVLDSVFNEKFSKQNCFVTGEAEFCGNMIVEENEQCDCGFKEDCTDKCCYGRGHPQQCRLKDQSSCSPSQGPCCTDDCTKKPANIYTCMTASDCNAEAKCDGINPSCPTPQPKNNMTACNALTQVCISGECRGSVCEIIGWEQCFLTVGEGEKNADKGKLCFVACEDPKASQKVCVSTGDPDGVAAHPKMTQLLDQLGESSIKLRPGAPCDNYRGYCDVFQKCRSVDADGPLARLKNLLFNEQTINAIKDWIIIHWWAVLLIGIGLVVFMGCFIHVCAVHTPSSNPNKKKHRRISDTLRRRPNPNRQQGPPPPYSAGPSQGGPPRGKGRGRGNQYEMRQQKI